MSADLTLLILERQLQNLKTPANGARQWMDRYGVIKTTKKTIDENVTIPAGTNAVSAGTLTVTGSNVVTLRRGG